MQPTPKLYPLAGVLNGTIADSGKPRLRHGQPEPKPYPKWSWQKWRKWRAASRAMFGPDYHVGDED